MARGKNGRQDGETYAGSRWSVMDGTTTKAPDFLDVDAEIIGEAVLNVLRCGDAVMISTTSDGGAARVTIFEGDRKHNQYVSNAGEFEKLLRGIAQSND